MNILSQIIEVKKDEIKKLRRDFSYNRFKDSEFFNTKRFSLETGLMKKQAISIIAEIKKASPSKGVILEDFNHMKIADVYMNNEVDAISVLTDVNFFQGSIEYLHEIAAIKSVPLLRKDFIIDEYQVFEAKSNGADAILLIAEVLSSSQIAELTHAAKEHDLEILLELHSEEQLEKIKFESNKIIGINNRNLADFSVNLNTTIKIAEQLPDYVLVVSESGISSMDDIKQLKDSRSDGILVGEHLMRSNNISDSLKELKEWCYHES